MPIIEPDAIIRADNYINEAERDATPANDEGRVPKLESDGYLDPLFIRDSLPNIRLYSNIFGGSTTQFDITNPSGTTFRYTYDSTGINPNISATTVPVGTVLVIAGQNFNANNNGNFVVIASGANYFEVTNASGVAENDRTLGSGSIKYGYQKPSNLKFLIVEVLGGGGGAGDGTGTSSTDDGGSGGGAGGYSKKKILASSLAATETLTIGEGGAGAVTGTGTAGGTSSFGSHCSSTGGNGGARGGGTPGSGGVGSGGDINTQGAPGQYGLEGASNNGGFGGSSLLGHSYGSGGQGGGGSGNGNSGNTGAIVITEHFI